MKYAPRFIVFFIVLVLLKSPAQGMIPQKIDFFKHKKTFGPFIDEVASKYNLGSATKKVHSRLPSFMASSLDKISSFGAKVLGFGQVSLDEIAFLERFFADEVRKQKNLKAFCLLRNRDRYLIEIFAMLSKTEMCMDDVIKIIHQNTLTYFDKPKDTTRKQMALLINEKNENNEFIIHNKKYYPCAIRNLFVVHVFRELQKQKNDIEIITND